jgi:hypothetical protein
MTGRIPRKRLVEKAAQRSRRARRSPLKRRIFHFFDSFNPLDRKK